ncbi:MAG: hypothetical protein AUK47_01170 [Deltaproteobacteria bacterium CG2_30_63_29]|nr:MAG: hypothetical protein AUK47_01170 [Deltaproteobacteria bacterium CG2_30_63_29]PIW00098.1 MAG: hypothetical protein COW42_08905 [Deltaproteobacteria bacterium CG17_big_fil_post_rev_8_21_14_2_50_63_7]PJB43266.1 MAG: hypothetical protein CO108_10395 [Deltaproteobacteria bacterium CG_4_9_14_3_um_filter_63_12]
MSRLLSQEEVAAAMRDDALERILLNLSVVMQEPANFEHFAALLVRTLDSRGWTFDEASLSWVTKPPEFEASPNLAQRITALALGGDSRSREVLASTTEVIDDDERTALMLTTLYERGYGVTSEFQVVERPH